MLKAQIFDVGGTLADTEASGRRVAYHRTFSEADLGWRRNEKYSGRLLAVSKGKEQLRYYTLRTSNIGAGVSRRGRRESFLGGFRTASLLSKPLPNTPPPPSIRAEIPDAEGRLQNPESQHEWIISKNPNEIIEDRDQRKTRQCISIVESDGLLPRPDVYRIIVRAKLGRFDSGDCFFNRRKIPTGIVFGVRLIKTSNAGSNLSRRRRPWTNTKQGRTFITKR